MSQYFLLSLILIQWLFKLVIEGANLLNLQENPPELLAQDFPHSTYQQSQNYLKANTFLDILHSTFFCLLLCGLILLGAFNLLDEFARHFKYGEILTGLIFLGSLTAGYLILDLPFRIYRTFVIEEKYGFNRTNPQTFSIDFAKQIFLAAILGGSVLACILWIFEATGNLAGLYCWIFLAVFQVILIYFAPTWIMPLFNKFTPLAEGALKQAIESYAKQQHFTLQGIFTMDGSKRSTKSNAFFTGFGKHRRVVLFDTLIANHTVEELVAVFAHEIGHYKKKHIFKLFVLSLLNTGLMLFLLTWFIGNPAFLQAFGLHTPSIYASLLFFIILYAPVSTLLSIGMNMLSRRFEYEADTYAVLTYHQPGTMISALKKLALKNLSNLTPHPWKVAYSYSHPTVLQRIVAIQKIQ